MHLRQKLLLSTAMLAGALTGYARRGYAQCAGGAGTYTCSGALAVTEDLTGAGVPLIVTTTPGFSITTAAYHAFGLSSTHSIAFTDNNSSTITGATFGIFARNYGPGALTITTTGAVTGISADGMNAVNSTVGSDMTVVANDVTGGAYGLRLQQNGSGVLSITTTGTVTGGANGHGIFAYAYRGSGLIVDAADVSGGTNGIRALHLGSGALTITANGDVTGTTGFGIHASNSAAGTGVTITTAAGTTVTGSTGIAAINNGGGALTITANGSVSGTASFGIYARNAAAGTDLTVTTAAGTTVTGSGPGIYARNDGSGALTITANGDVTSPTDRGIFARNFAAGTDLTVTTAAGTTVTGTTAIDARNSGSGALAITANGTVTSTTNAGIHAYNSSAGSSLTVTTGPGSTVTGNTNGINAFNYGGALTITANGNVSGSARGINAAHYGTDLIVTTAAGTTVSGGTSGIFARNNGSGALTITADGDVTGNGADGINAANWAGATSLAVTTAAGTTVTGGSYGIVANNFGSGTLTIAANGNVTGTNEDGIYARHDAGGQIDITVAATGTVTSNGVGAEDFGIQLVGGPGNVIVAGTVNGGAGGAISFDQGAALADRLELRPGAVINGLALAGPGADTLAFGGAGNGAFDLTAIDTGANTQQYRSFETFQVESGTWAFSGATTAAFSVDGGTVMGTGTFGALTVNSGGTVAPGTTGSFGTVNVSGNVTFNAGAVYQVKVNDGGQSDLISAGGQAVINGGTVQVLAQAGTYDPSMQYTIVTGTGGRIGEFDALTHNFAFLTPSLLYDANNVYLLLDVIGGGPNFVGFAGTPNQSATAGALQSLTPGNPVFDALLLLPNDQSVIQQAFDSLSGEVHASSASVMLDESRHVRDALLGRARQSFGAGGGPLMALAPSSAAMAFAEPSAAPLGYADRPAAKAPTVSERIYAIWMQGFGSWGTLKGDGNAATLDRSHGGFIAGVDATFAETWRVGAATGYSRSSFHVDGRASSGSSDNYFAALYGGTQSGPWGLRGGGSLTWHDIATKRHVTLLNETLEADYNALTGQLFGEIGYGFTVGQTAFEPFANIAYVHFNRDDFTETGGAAALSGGGSADIAFTTLGLRAAALLGDTNGMTTTLRGMLGWRHALGDVTPELQLAFATGSVPFTIAGVPIAQNALLVEAGLDIDVLRNVKVGITYSGQLAGDAQDHAVKGNLLVRF